MHLLEEIHVTLYFFNMTKGRQSHATFYRQSPRLSRMTSNTCTASVVEEPRNNRFDIPGKLLLPHVEMHRVILSGGREHA